jgi:hypothetical protein
MAEAYKIGVITPEKVLENCPSAVTVHIEPPIDFLGSSGDRAARYLQYGTFDEEITFARSKQGEPQFEGGYYVGNSQGERPASVFVIGIAARTAVEGCLPKAYERVEEHAQRLVGFFTPAEPRQ